MSEPFLGEVRVFGFNYAPRGWAFCRGQIMSISQNTALFSLLGTFYGGDGRSNFALPNLQGNIPVSSGQGAGLASYSLGQAAGSVSVTLLTSNLPSHFHTLPAGGPANMTTPSSSTMIGGGGRGSLPIYSTNADGTNFNQGMVAVAGGNQPHNNMMPYVAMNFCICLQGIYPARN